MRKVFCYLVSASLCACSTTTDEAGKAEASETSFDIGTVKQVIDSTNQKFAAASVAGDSAAVVSYYHSGAKVLPPNMPGGGADIMGSMSASLPKMGVKSFSLSSTEVTGNAEEVVEVGTYEMGDGSKTIDKGKYIVIWKPENGQWKLWRDIWNSDNAPAPGAN